MTAQDRTIVGVVVERRKAASQWIDFTWRVATILPGRPEAESWTVLSVEGDCTTFYAGTASIELHQGETTNYRDNLASAVPSVWIALRPTDAGPPYRVVAATVDPSEGEAFTEAGTDLIESVPMPDLVREAVAAFVAEHHVEKEVFKRKRDRANPESLARRMPGEEEKK